MNVGVLDNCPRHNLLFACMGGISCLRKLHDSRAKGLKPRPPDMKSVALHHITSPSLNYYSSYFLIFPQVRQDQFSDVRAVNIWNNLDKDFKQLSLTSF